MSHITISEIPALVYTNSISDYYFETFIDFITTFVLAQRQDLLFILTLAVHLAWMITIITVAARSKA
jgi:hypothetical protein